MARGVLVVLALAALGFGVWIAMGELGGGPSHDALDEGGGGSALVEEVSTGPKLVAHGRALTAEARLADWVVNFLFGAMPSDEQIGSDDRLEWHLYLKNLHDTGSFFRDLEAN